MVGAQTTKPWQGECAVRTDQLEEVAENQPRSDTVAVAAALVTAERPPVVGNGASEGQAREAAKTTRKVHSNGNATRRMAHM